MTLPTVLAGTGYLQKPEKIGHGYSKKKVKHKAGSKLTWHFKAPKVHDFVWAADPDYRHDIAKVDDDLELHFFYRSDSIAENWKELQPYAVKCFREMNKKFGRYPYKQYSIIQGGDGGMEYPMATLITGDRRLESLIGVTFHEAIHSWYQMLLGTNESKYSWMDEGFTSYADAVVSEIIMGRKSNRSPHYYSHLAYQMVAKSGKEEPLTTHSDHYNTNRGYGVAAYSKGAVFLDQLSYVIGQDTFERAMLRYFYTWRFKHPNPTDLKRIMEKESGLELDWYWENFVGTTKQIDYGIKSVSGEGESVSVVLERVGQMPMPLDAVVTYTDGSTENFYIPMRIMRGEKADKKSYGKTTLLKDWGWTYPEYGFSIPRKSSEIKSIELDPSGRMSDVNRDNNVFPTPSTLRFEGNK